MNTNGYKIRLEKKEDYRKTENLVREAFWNVYKPGCMEHYLLHTMRSHRDFIPSLNFVMEINSKIIGHVAYAKSYIKGYDGTEVIVLSLGPICIAPEYKRQGYGKILLEYSLKEARNQGYGAVFLEGNFDFYGKSGFSHASEKGIDYPGFEKGKYVPFFLFLELQKDFLSGVTGNYCPSSAYMVDDRAADEFDKSFPKKEKLKLPGQIF